MTSSENKMRFVWIGVAGVLGVAGIAVGALFYMTQPATQLTPTAGGVILESLLPEDIDFALSINPTNDEQRDAFLSVAEALVHEKKSALAPLMIDEFIAGQKLQITSEEILPLLPQTVRFLGGAKKISEDELVTYGLLAVSDPAAARTVVQNYYTNTKSDQAVFDDASRLYKTTAEGTGVQMGMIDDVLFVTDGGRASVDGIFAHGQFGRKTFASAEQFKEYLAQGADPFYGYAFVHKSAILALLSTSQKQAQVKVITQASSQQNSEPLSLFKRVPNAGNLLYGEVTDLGALITSLLASVKESAPEQQDPFALIGVNFETDVKPFLGKNFSLSLQDVGAPLPALSLYVDSSGAPDKAKALVQTLDTLLKPLLSLANTSLQTKEGGTDPIMTTRDLATSRVKGTTIQIFPQRVSEEVAAIPLFQLYEKAFELSYGVTDDNLFFITTLPAVEVALMNPTTLTADSLVQENAPFWDGASSMGVISADGLRRFVKATAGTIERLDSGEQLSEETRAQLDLFDTMLAPLKGLTVAGRRVGEYEITEGVLRLQ